MCAEQVPNRLRPLPKFAAIVPTHELLVVVKNPPNFKLGSEREALGCR
jgi:hypothetical protein